MLFQNLFSETSHGIDERSNFPIKSHATRSPLNHEMSLKIRIWIKTVLGHMLGLINWEIVPFIP